MYLSHVFCQQILSAQDLSEPVHTHTALLLVSETISKYQRLDL